MIYDLQKASMWKRISAFLFDAILLGIVAVLFALGLSAVVGYNGYNDRLDAAYARYGAEYGVDFSMSLAEYEALTQEEMQQVESAYAALSRDEEAVWVYNMVIQLTLLITSLGILLAFIALEFAAPLLFGNGQTLGKKIFGIGLMRTDGVKVAPVALFIRTVLGKYAIETMIPVLIVVMIYFNAIGILGVIILGLILVLQLIVMIASRNHSLIHDLLAATVAVDIASQMIFDTKEELIAYKQKVHAEKAAKQTY